MSAVVIRCPACGGASRVAPDALGHMVGCPRCQSPFVAVEEAPAAALPSQTNTSAPAKPRRPRARPVRDPNAPRPKAAIPIAPPREVPPELTADGTPVLAAEVPDPEHDPHTRPVGGLPLSVMVGFALMPFAIPLLWFIGPIVTGKEASLSLAVPVALAVAASALCFGVVYTIDWTATTRIKGVVMLVGLAYFTAAGLYFLKKDVMDRVQNFFRPSLGWVEVYSQDHTCHVRMPWTAAPVKEQPLADLKQMSEVRHATFQPHPDSGVYEYRFAVSRAEPDGDAGGWLAAVRTRLWLDRAGEVVKNGGTLISQRPLWYTEKADKANPDGHEWQLGLGGDRVRIVRVFLIKGRVYYLSAEVPDMRADDEYAEQFFKSFEILPPQPPRPPRRR